MTMTTILLWCLNAPACDPGVFHAVIGIMSIAGAGVLLWAAKAGKINF